ncbi:MAG: hypothetical protein U0183_00910 [Polyangiaceae bacterium]
MTRARVAMALALAGFLGCGSAPAPKPPPAIAPPKVEPGSIDVLSLVGDAPKRAVANGAGPHAIVAVGLVGEGQRLGAFVEASDDSCLLAYARGASAVEDLDLFALTDDGSPLALDESPDPRPAILVCPPRPRRFYLALQAANGEGMAVLVAHRVPKARARAVAVALGARGALGVMARAEAFPGLEDAIRARRAALGGTWEESKRGSVAVDTHAPSFVAITAGAGDCFDVLVLPNDDVGLVEVELLDDEGRLVARARGPGETRGVVVCTEDPFAGTLRLRSHLGQGVCGYVLSRAPASYAKEAAVRPEVALHGVPLPLADAEKARNDALGRAGFAAPTTTSRGALVGAKIVSKTEVLKAACSRIDLVGGSPLRRGAVTAWSDAGKLLGEGDGLLGGVAYVCASGKARIDIEARGAGGPFALTVRPLPWSAPELVGAPLAASRMLSRASSGPNELFDGTAVGVRALSLSDTSLASSTEDVPAGACLGAYLGMEGAASGVTLRAVDEKSQDELDRAHGESSAGVRACAGPKGARVRFEARTSSGTAKAVLGLRKL